MSHFYPHTPEQLKWDQDFQFFSTQIAESAAYGGRLTKVVEESSGLVPPSSSSLPLIYIRTIENFDRGLSRIVLYLFLFSR